jgi:uncharacterized protein (UPF0332 family)
VRKMIYRISKGTLFNQGLIKKCDVDWNAIKNLLKRTFIDLDTADRNIEDDPECAYNYAYNAMLRSGLALMFSEGYRPDIKDKHQTIVRYVSRALGKRFKDVISNYDFMRRKRHRYIYEPDIPCSLKEAKDSVTTAKHFVDVILKYIKKNNPQAKFNFIK